MFAATATTTTTNLHAQLSGAATPLKLDPFALRSLGTGGAQIYLVGKLIIDLLGTKFRVFYHKDACFKILLSGTEE